MSPHQAVAADLSDHTPLFHPLAADLNQLAENEDFWSNVGRYGSYFFSVLLGTAYTAVKPIGGLLRRPVSAVLTISAIIGLYIFVSTTVTAMLGVNSEEAFVLPPQLTN
ncbi:g8600 [Coccomyxa elongata]